jgi:hypothetical protein
LQHGHSETEECAEDHDDQGNSQRRKNLFGQFKCQEDQLWREQILDIGSGRLHQDIMELLCEDKRPSSGATDGIVPTVAQEWNANEVSKNG